MEEVLFGATKCGQTTQQIPGYAGFIPGVKGENLFGKTYGQITNLSAQKAYHSGSNPDELKYTTSVGEAYLNNTDQNTRHIQEQNPLKRLNFAQTVTQTDCDRDKANYGISKYQEEQSCPKLQQQTGLTYQQALEMAQQ